MKKFVFLGLLIVMTFSIAPMFYSPVITFAEEGQYARVLNQTTYLYNSADTSSPCFLIPETYYVKLIRDDGEYYFVNYQEDLAPYYKAIAGYCKKSDLYMCDYTPSIPYLNYNIDVYDGARGYKSSSLSKVDYLFNNGNPIIYYGKIKINNVLFYYVLAHGEFRCYINSNECVPLSYPLNTDPLPISNEDEVITTPETVTPVESKTDVSDKLKIALILILVIPALIATAFLFKPQKKRSEKQKYFYDENDYE
jgi:hypothetical protein